MPHSGPKLSDFYTPSRTKVLENHAPHSGTYIYSLHGTPPHPPSILGPGRTSSFSFFFFEGGGGGHFLF